MLSNFTVEGKKSFLFRGKTAVIFRAITSHPSASECAGPTSARARSTPRPRRHVSVERCFETRMLVFPSEKYAIVLHPFVFRRKSARRGGLGPGRAGSGLASCAMLRRSSQESFAQCSIGRLRRVGLNRDRRSRPDLIPGDEETRPRIHPGAGGARDYVSRHEAHDNLCSWRTPCEAYLHIRSANRNSLTGDALPNACIRARCRRAPFIRP